MKGYSIFHLIYFKRLPIELLMHSDEFLQPNDLISENVNIYKKFETRA